MVGKTLGHYRILEKIGAGGMGEVYRAHDDQLDRDVALKVLPASNFRNETARARLLHEARAAASLNHPHICTIHEVGEANGHAYIAMEYVEGQPLSTRLAGGPLSAALVLHYGLQLADALAHAHERGIVHRDLKSANVVCTGEGRAKVLDFGLAKHLSKHELNEVTRSQASMTVPGTLVGTLAYTAPEQLHGQPADARSDVWSLGVVLYEMAAGTRPFQGLTGFALSSAILNQQPAPLPRKVYLELRAVIDRCLQKDPEQRYQRSSEVRGALEAIHKHTAPSYWLGLRYVLVRRHRLVLAIAMLVLLAVAIELNVGGLRTLLRGGASAPRIESVAVLPLENLSGDPGQDYFAVGMTDALITDLARLGGLKRVIPRGSVMRYQGSKKSLPEIARELKVEALITGSVLRSGNHVRITAQLINPATEQQLWADRYERELRDVLVLQNEVTRAIAHEIQINLTPEEITRLAQYRPVNPEAYDAYLDGRFHWYKRTPEALNTAERYFQLALNKDPRYAPAHAGIGIVWYTRADVGLLPTGEALPRAKTAMLKALELDDNVAEVHLWLANLAAWYEWDWPAAEREFQRALELDPSYADAHFGYADFLVTRKRQAEWQTEIQRTLELDPPNFFFQVFYGWHLLYLRRDDEAIAQFRKVLETQPEDSSAHMGLWGAFYKKAMYAEALAEASRFFAVLHDGEAVDALHRGYAEAGYHRAMKSAADTLAERSKRTYVPAMRVARLYAHAEEKDAALEWLEKAYQRHDLNLAHINVGWDWDTLRGSPRFKALLRRMNFPA